ncbi:SsrA-binding protein SmpB [Nesterenkonia alba]|uniref:SsrA-binding protein SmpB n=1 Tax=Nesterenkonia alba TaxID=515814 RepID=UPI0003B4248D|nr:SsrA-binding protein SmpB [Nesterenkonia alba]
MGKYSTNTKKAGKKAKDPNNHVIALNRRARHDYQILDKYEAGVVLTGTEVKSLREGQASLTDGFAAFDDAGELWLEQVHIPEYLNGTWTNHSARRKRKLLLHAKELTKISRQIEDPGLTLVPLSLYFKDGRVKVELGVARGQREFDKRHALREKQDAREAQRAMRYRNLRGVV